VIEPAAAVAREPAAEHDAKDKTFRPVDGDKFYISTAINYTNGHLSLRTVLALRNAAHTKDVRMTCLCCALRLQAHHIWATLTRQSQPMFSLDTIAHLAGRSSPAPEYSEANSPTAQIGQSSGFLAAWLCNCIS
jgi:hypothetical protein